MRNSQGMKLFLVLLVCTVYIFSCATYGALAYDRFFTNQSRQSTDKSTVSVNNKKAKNSEQQSSGQKQAEVISESTISYPDQGELSKWVQQFPTIEIGPLSSFSLLTQVGKSRYSAEALSVIAETIYKAVIPTDFAITERHISRELPSFAEEGFEAKIDPDNNMDFVFTNASKKTFTLNFKEMDNLFYVSVKGEKPSYSYKTIQSDRQTFTPKTIIQFDAKLPFNSVKQGTAGKDGFVLKVYREKVDENGVSINKTLVAEDFYPPINQVVISSLVTKGVASSTNTDTNTNTNANTNTNTGNSSGEGGNSSSLTVPTDPSSDTNNAGNTNGTGTPTTEENTTPDSSDLWGKPNEEPK